jgi:hypothetical protein
MADDFSYDGFLGSSKDKETIRPVAERLRNDGLKIWFDDWELGPKCAFGRQTGERAEVRAMRIEECLDHARMLVIDLHPGRVAIRFGVHGDGNVAVSPPKL